MHWVSGCCSIMRSNFSNVVFAATSGWSSILIASGNIKAESNSKNFRLNRKSYDSKHQIGQKLQAKVFLALLPFLQKHFQAIRRLPAILFFYLIFAVIAELLFIKTEAMTIKLNELSTDLNRSSVSYADQFGIFTKNYTRTRCMSINDMANTSIVDQTPHPESNHNKNSNHPRICFVLVLQRRSWSEADQYCNQAFTGSRLASIHSPQTQHFLETWLLRYAIFLLYLLTLHFIKLHL